MNDARTVYVETLAKMADMEGNAGLDSPRPRSWNRLVDRLQAARRDLSKSEEGQAVIAALLTDTRVTVRLWAASHALHWDEPRARDVLTAIASDAHAGLNRLNAEMTLKEYDAGRLNPDW
ncbi:hypothetical protein PROP_03124 [Propionicimonas sp. T2.31MG-18]|uniref:hypothetical protein n=1 Tax=Propionicimonas sp. T2.31MG-18 TaxID=3157620 RepID=UPI0035ED1605